MAKETAIRSRFFPLMQEYFEAQGERPPLEECLHKVDQCDVLIVIVAHRYGWIPEDQSGSEKKSITWLETERALANNKKILAFLVDPKADWPDHLKEKARILHAYDNNLLTPELTADVKLAEEKLQEFKNWLNKKKVRNDFTTPQDLQTKIIHALYEWRERHREEFPADQTTADPQLYLQWLHDENAYIDIRGLQVGTGKAHKFGIEEIYIPLTTSADIHEKRKQKSAHDFAEQPRRIQLHEVLTSRQLAIIGDPGAGKTTFLRRIVFALSQALLHIVPDAAETRLGLTEKPLPVFIKLTELVPVYSTLL